MGHDSQVEPSQWILLLLTTMALGYASWALPPLLIHGAQRWPIPIFFHPLTDASIAFPVSIICLVGSGLLLSLLFSWPAMLIAPVTSLQLFVFAFFDQDPHQLLPFEIFIYAIYSLPALIGALIGYAMRELITKKKKGNEQAE
jgi:hypothetical protein